MRPQNELAMIVALYLSKLGEGGLDRRGFKSYRQAFDAIGRTLDVKANSVKNWRDEFDHTTTINRKGWYHEIFDRVVEKPCPRLMT